MLTASARSLTWWEVPFSAVLGALYDRCREAVAAVDAETLAGAGTECPRRPLRSHQL